MHVFFNKIDNAIKQRTITSLLQPDSQENSRLHNSDADSESGDISKVHCATAGQAR